MKLKLNLAIKFRAWGITFYEVNEVIDMPITTPIPINQVLLNERGITLRVYTVAWPS